MGFWDTLKALFVYDTAKSINEQQSHNKTLADIVAEDKADEQMAAKDNVSRYKHLEECIETAFEYLLDNTTPGYTDLHEQRMKYAKILNAMPLLIALESDGELTGHDGVNMYVGISTIIEQKHPSITSFSGREIVEAKKNWNDLYWEINNKAGANELGDLWYSMMFLSSINTGTNVSQMVSKVFKYICDAADTIAQMMGKDYKYSNIPSTIAQLSYQYEALTSLSRQPDFSNYNKFDADLEDVDYSQIKLRVTQEAHPKIMAYFEGNKK